MLFWLTFKGLDRKPFEYYGNDTHFVHSQTVRNISCMNKKSFTVFLVRIIEAQFEKKLRILRLKSAEKIRIFQAEFEKMLRNLRLPEIS